MQHVSYIEQLVASSGIGVLKVIKARWVILEGKSLKVAESVIKGYREN